MIARILKSILGLVVVACLVISLTINAAFFVGGSLYTMTTSVIEAATGLRSLASRQAAEIAVITTDIRAERKLRRDAQKKAADASAEVAASRTASRKLRNEISEQSAEIAAEKRISKMLRSDASKLSAELVTSRNVERNLRNETAKQSAELAAEKRVSKMLRSDASKLSAELATSRSAERKLRNEIAEQSAELAAEKRVSKTLRSEASELAGELDTARKRLDDPASRLVTYRGRRVALSEAVDETADRISTRAKKTAGREVGAMYGESIPWAGTFVIMAATAWELTDLCNTMKDMSELKRAFSIAADDDENQKDVCGMKMPTREKIWDVAKSSPKEAWRIAKDVMPSLDEMKETADINWTGVGESMGDFASSTIENGSDVIIGGYKSTLSASKGVWDKMFGGDDGPLADLPMEPAP